MLKAAGTIVVSILGTYFGVTPLLQAIAPDLSALISELLRSFAAAFSFLADMRGALGE